MELLGTALSRTRCAPATFIVKKAPLAVTELRRDYFCDHQADRLIPQKPT